MTGKGYHNIRQ